MVGNFIADTLRGKSYLKLEKSIATGVEIHRTIDHYTDTHPTVLATRKVLYPYFGKYASVVQDVYYDHFLAINWPSHSPMELTTFVSHVYDTLARYTGVFNDRSQRTYHYMQEHDWLGNYRYMEGIDRSLKGLSRRASFPSNMENGIEPLQANFQELQQHFDSFFPELAGHIAAKFEREIATCQSMHRKP